MGLCPKPRDLALSRQDFLDREMSCAHTPGIPASESALGIAVGMIIADHPPHRSVRAELPHTAPPLDSTVEANIRIRMKSAWTRNPSIKDGPQLFPIWFPPLTTAT
jgi:hypothetical protein